MFPEERDPAAPNKAKKPADRTTKLLWTIVGILIACVTVLTVMILRANGQQDSISVPQSVKQAVKSPIYLPAKLPGNYAIDKNSFALAENNAVLTFYAKDGVGANLIFTEQPKPRNFAFDDFYKNNFTDARTISDVPYPSVWGKSTGGRIALSVVTEDTWILLTTSAPLTHEDMGQIAASISKR